MDTPRQRGAAAASVVSFRGSARAERGAAAEGRELLDMVLNNMSQGVLMFDQEMRLVFCNRGYIEMYGLSSDIAKPGCTLRDLLKHRIATGTFSDDPEEYIEKVRSDLAGGETSNMIVRSGVEGRVFSIVNKPLAGGGWLATHEDVTERQRAEERIVHMARHDALTDLPNRVLLRERLEHELKRVKRGEMPRRALPRSRPLQGRQRHARPSGRRRAAEGRGGPAARLHPRARYDRAPGRRRIRDHHDVDAAADRRGGASRGASATRS